MLACNCSLAGTRACENCLNRKAIEYFYDQTGTSLDHSLRKRVVIERFDENGKLIERITEE